ncbi:oxygen-independent coproporphyrinogen III oxidase [Alkalilimnicola ehrlichii]|uniref:Coproporphyrinogen-III oxidase n=1 Tax=Alkalilimnicola ehrlichii TaxID=351052 RepID=A0A3E0WX05_9GAMM|nr:oxygen-independent coproporphyrinogen III oxidase [Alkalilimnicola ehrlichii]RFA36546.1 oxygen-independent coproporphyrinogen III oxidase [Alkalilimnicola ehrlichii]
MSESVRFDKRLLTKYDQTGPRYTSYPTAPQFDESFGPEAYRKAAAASNEDLIPKRLSVYVHIPFCRSLCYYCACNKIITQHQEKAAQYLGYLKREIKLQAPLFDVDRPLSQLHLGGGTPTYFDDEQLAELIASLSEQFVLDGHKRREASIEVDPRTVSPERIALLSELGFNRLSFGVQDFDPVVQAAVNRMQTVEQVQELMAAARRARFRSISIDLIYGLPHQTPTSFATTLEQVIALRPDRLAVYNYAHLPQLFRAQRLIHAEDLPSAEQKLDLLGLTIESLTRAGYVHIGMDHFALPEDELTQAQRQGTLHRNFQGYSTHADCDLIGLGMTSIGKIGNTYSQNVRELPRYYHRLENNELPVFKGYVLSTDDRLRRDVINKLMCHGRVDFRAIEERYPIVFRNYFAGELMALKPMLEDGLNWKSAHYLRLLPAGELLMRNIAMVFDRYIAQSQRGTFSRTV